MSTKSTAAMIRRHIERLPRGTVFTPSELVHARLGTQDAVRQTLRRLVADGTIQRLSKGYYDVPRSNPKIGFLSPTPEAIIAAHERKTGSIIERSEVDAANKLGLTPQVVARPVYRTNLFSRTLNIGGQRVELRTASPRALTTDADDPAELVIDALSAIGKDHVTGAHIAKLRKFVKEHQLGKKLQKRARRGSLWMLPLIDEILAEERNPNG